MIRMTKTRCMVCTALGGLLAACNTNPPSPLTSGYVSDQWSEQMSQFAIVPVFPPRADLQVGDLYLSCDDSTPASASSASTPSISPSSGNLDHHVMWLASLDGIVTSTSGRTTTPGLLDTQYMKRVHMPVIPVASAPSQSAAAPASAVDADTASATKAKKLVKVAAKTKPASKPAATATAASDVFLAAPPKTLMPVSLPEFFAVAATSAQAQALIPFPSILAKAGMSYSKAQNIEISVQEAESYGVPVSIIYRAYLTQANSQNLQDAFRIFNAVKGKFCTYGTPAMVLVNEVYATRAINVSVTFSQNVSGDAAVGLSYPTGSSQATILSALTKYLSPAPASGASTTDAPAALVPAPASGASAPTIEQATAYVAQLNALYKSLGASSEDQQYPGVQVSFINGNGSGVVMNRQFDSPVVIGYRGLRVTALAPTGEQQALQQSQ